MMRLRRASVITALSLLAWAATASAECAWVLWSSTQIKGGDGRYKPPVYELNLAYPKREECGAAVRTTGDAIKKTRPGYKVYQASSSPYEVAVEDADGNNVHWYCLPDTVDPRGPKGK